MLHQQRGMRPARAFAQKQQQRYLHAQPAWTAAAGLRRGRARSSAPRAASSADDLLILAATAEETLKLQLRSLPTVSTDGLVAAAAAAATAGDKPSSRQQQGGDPQRDDHQQQQQQQQQAPFGPLAALLSRLPRFDGRFRGLVLLNMMVMLMGSNWVVVKANFDSSTMTDSMMFAAMRFGLAATLFLPFLKPDPRITRAGVEIGVYYAAGYITQALALAHTAASRASLLSTFTVLAVPMLAGLSGQRVRPVVWACAAAALAGTAMLEEGSSLGPPNVGDAWAVASALGFALQMMAAEKHVNNLPPKSELPLMGVSMITVAALAAAAAAVTHWRAGDLPAAAAGLGSLFADWRAALLPPALGGGGAVPAAEAAEAMRTLQQLGYTAFLSTDLLLFVELVALQDVSSTDAAMIYSLEPVAGALMAYFFLNERWGAWGWAGGGLILAASLFTQMRGATGGGGGGEAESGANEGVGTTPAEAAAVAARK